MQGWIKLHRQLLESTVFDNERLLKLWVWCLLKATHREHDQLVGRRTVKLQPGQFIFGRKKAALALGYPESTVWEYMQLLQSMGNVNIKSNNKYSVVTLTQWALYQSDEPDSDSKTDNRSTTDQQQIDTNKNVENEKNEKKDTVPYEEIKERYNSTCTRLPQVKKLSSERKKHIKARYKELGSIEEVQSLFDRVAESNFLSGDNNRSWKANLDWIMNENNMVKIIEGKYDNRDPDGPSSGELVFDY